MAIQRSRTGWRGALARHPVTFFFLIAYGLSWLAELFLFGLLGLSAALTVPVITFGPTVAALVMMLIGRPTCSVEHAPIPRRGPVC